MANRKRGRPRRANKYGGHIAAAEQKFADFLAESADILIALAKGIWVEDAEDTDRDGKPRVYQKPPSLAAIKFIHERLSGKADVMVRSDDDAGEEAPPRIIIPGADERARPKPQDAGGHPPAEGDRVG